jgi:hypothetical protein
MISGTLPIETVSADNLVLIVASMSIDARRLKAAAAAHSRPGRPCHVACSAY